MGATWLGLCCVGAFCPAAQNPANASPKSEGNSFSERDSWQLLTQISGGLVAHNQKKLLGAFDVAAMTNGPLFRQQIIAFFGQTGIIRVHFNRAQAGMEDGKGVVTVNVEMEADLRDEGRPPVRKQAELRFVAEKSAAGWKFTEVQPRTFFSTAQP
ncbi:MAG TPA: hypothetical protein VI488_08555 [Candidatus Angelobacter sp.]